MPKYPSVPLTLSRLLRSGELMRAGRGLYLRPVKSRFGAHPREASKIVEALVAQRDERIAPDGAMANRVRQIHRCDEDAMGNELFGFVGRRSPLP